MRRNWNYSIGFESVRNHCAEGIWLRLNDVDVAAKVSTRFSGSPKSSGSLAKMAAMRAVEKFSPEI
jgi:hypothetical protein